MIEETLIKALPQLLINLGEYVATECKNIADAETNFKILETTLAKAQPLLGYFRLSMFLLKDSEIQQNFDKFANLYYRTEDFINEMRDPKNRDSDSRWSKLLKLRQPHKTKKHLELIQTTLVELKPQMQIIMDALLSEAPPIDFNSPSFIGRENVVEEIKKDLISGQSPKGISIIGRRGLGKTALARFISRDQDIKENFPKVEWIDVEGGNFILTNEEKKLANVVTDRECQTLIIFDNLLYISWLEWLALWQRTLGRRNNIKILITTSNPKVSKETRTKQYFLDSLPNPKCKELIMNIATLQNESLTQSSMEDVNKLVTKCEGLPLLASTIGDRLAKLECVNWHNFSKKDIWEWENFQKEIFPFLKGSYKDMPPKLMDCFSYFSLFPCNHDFHINVPHEIKKHNHIDDLFQLWESEGFLRPREDESTFKDIANEQMQWLQERSLVQFDESGEVYKLQRLSQKIAEVASSKTCLRFDQEGPTSLPENTRHLSLLRENLQILIDSEDKKVKHLRTILSLNDIILHTDVKSTILPKIFQHGSCLRVLSFNGIKIQELSSSIKSLIHLCYLDVSRTPIRSLPEELVELSNLLFLKLSNTPNLHKLPDNFHKLTNLQCIGWDIDDIQRINPIPKIGCLSKLQTLPLFRVGYKEGFFIGELQKMKFLQNSICVWNLENVKSKKEAELAKLHEKESLTKIELQWNNAQNINEVAAVLTGLKPHHSLSKLKITRYSAQNFPDWISDSKFMLEELHLYQCDCNSLPALRQLKILKKLVFEGMNQLSQVDEIFCGPRPKTDAAGFFPLLESLIFKDMAILQRWINLGPDDMPCLHDLQIESCPELIEFPSHVFTSLQTLTIISCQKLDKLPKVTNLSSTSTLLIRGSDNLKEKCREGGEAWSTVNKFQSVTIDKNIIPTTPHGSGEHHQNIQQSDEGLKDVIQENQANEVTDGGQSHNNQNWSNNLPEALNNHNIQNDQDVIQENQANEVTHGGQSHNNQNWSDNLPEALTNHKIQNNQDNEVTTLSGALPPPDWFSSHWLIHINFGGIKLIIFILAIIVLCVAIKWI